MSDITDTGCNLATADRFQAEIARLAAVNDRLRGEIERLRAMVFNPVTLTDAERQAIRRAAAVADAFHDSRLAAALRCLLERLR